MSTPASPSSATDGPGVVLMNWSEEHAGLVDQLSRTMAGAGVARITCVGEPHEGPAAAAAGGLEVRHVALDPKLGFDDLVAWLQREGVPHASAVIVLPQSEASDPDSLSRLMCAAIRKACGNGTGPNVLVEVEDPEAAFEFVGLGVATVFYSGHLRAALLGQASVDLGVFQFILGLLRGRFRVRTIEIPEAFRAQTFADAAVELETDDRGRPMTVIGVARPPAQGGGVVTNPGPQTPLRDAAGLLVLVTGDEPEQERDAR